MFEKWFEFLLKFKRINYEEGNFVFQAGNIAYLFLGLFLILLICFLIIYFLTNIYTNNRSRALSISLRILAMLLLCIPLFEPMVMIPDIIPNENFLAVLIDNSASMGIPDGYFGRTRFNDINTILLDNKKGILPELEKNFKVRNYVFSNEASRVDNIADLGPNGRETNFTASLRRVLSDFKGLPLSGILLFSDGGDNSKDDARSIAEELRGLDIPLHIVGLGNESLKQERELLDVTTNKELLEGTGAEVEVKVRSWIDEKAPVTFNIYKGEKLAFTKDMNLKGNGKIDILSFFYEPEGNDVAEYTLQIATAPNEVNLENNTLNMLIDSRKDTIRILYLEGYLRSDFKFIKRALEDDQVLDFTSIMRTGTGKYYRQGIYTVNELKGGFPESEEDLDRFKAVIFGDIEANFFSISQIEMVEKFVRKRGGGFLMLGGSNSFAEGYFWNTPIADLLPVELDPKRKMTTQPDFKNPAIPEEEQGFKFVPTGAGLENPILKLSTDAATNNLMWDEMPRLFTINYFGAVKPGATVLAEKPEDKYGGLEPLLVIQRYGKGRTAALATASTWRWQMLLDAKDTRYERFWRQFMRWLSTDSPGKVNIELTENRFEPGTEIPIRVSVYDNKYDPLIFADVSGIVTDPFGGIHEIQFLPELTEEGEYLSVFALQDPGIYKIEVVAKQNGEIIGKQYQSFISRPSKKEFYNATLKRNFLENLGESSGGIYYEPSEVKTIPTNLKERKTSTSVYRTEYLWDLPLLFLILVILFSAEWIYRRNKGLP